MKIAVVLFILLTACSPPRVTWQQLLEEPMATHDKLGGPALRDCRRVGNHPSMDLTAAGSLYVCPYDLESASQPSGPWRIAGALLEINETYAPQALKADPTGLISETWLQEAGAVHVRTLYLHDPTSVSLTQDVPARLGLEGFLPAAPLHPKGARWLRPDAKPGEVYVVETREHPESPVRLELKMLPDQDFVAKHQLKRDTRPLPTTHVPVAMSTKLTAEEGTVLLRLSTSDLHVGEEAVSSRTPEALWPVLEKAMKIKRRRNEIMRQSFEPKLAIDAQRSMSAAEVSRWLAQIVTTSEDVSWFITRGVPRNAEGLPGLSTLQHVRQYSSLLLVRGANKPQQDTRSLRVEIHPEGIHVGRGNDGEPVAWLDPDPACAPYQICRTEDRVPLQELARLDVAQDWPKARDAYKRAFASLSPVDLRALVAENAPQTNVTISLIAADPELSWQTYESLRYALHGPLEVPGQACERGIETPDALLFASWCSEREHKLPTRDVIIALVGEEVPESASREKEPAEVGGEARSRRDPKSK